eukprot:CAMPEP_0181217688 /NCGR_PEP_ID=MMETSP1096-20121128/27286_1 /TAXON_ID=156174 ORGANISM="Chrysochromulina ericina, Strain CCMP281" /NCGR_SAMPLE_ID=MMETSP1096 /ASSEMBLY_ACC=CAM_ASM_000453 /LENGTH=198 /DNA_ID=CAMNT_0023309839 /DNA_START=28 /DNA_END=625 /DNA_ORIENTATION=+
MATHAISVVHTTHDILTVHAPDPHPVANARPSPESRTCPGRRMRAATSSRPGLAHRAPLRVTRAICTAAAVTAFVGDEEDVATAVHARRQVQPRRSAPPQPALQSLRRRACDEERRGPDRQRFRMPREAQQRAAVPRRHSAPAGIMGRRGVIKPQQDSAKLVRDAIGHCHLLLVLRRGTLFALSPCWWIVVVQHVCCA